MDKKRITRERVSTKPKKQKRMKKHRTTKTYDKKV